MHAKMYGQTWVYWPHPNFTGALQQQPNNAAVRMMACSTFTPDYKTFFDERGALDAPDELPSGGARAIDFPPAGDGMVEIRLQVSSIWRDGP